MSIQSNQAPVAKYERADYERAVINSALWAVAGDALGWMTELSRGTSGVEHRTGRKRVSETTEWKRVIGGRSGVTVDFPAGTYSDDTQLRLCVSRSIRGDGSFDVEAFAKVEVTTWQGYCLGAGVGSKAAAANLSKRGVNWFSNFFATDQQRYISAGGNGAAMRIQPHVWSASGTLDEMISRVLRDALVTHGHPHGFCGAIFHSLCLWEVLSTRKVPSIESAMNFVSYMQEIPSAIERDSELASLWEPTWERETGKSLKQSIHEFQLEAQSDISKIKNIFGASKSPDYHEILHQLGCLTDKYRGSGFKTALAALTLCQIYSPERIEEALALSANELESDTDTITTMAGAMLGALAKNEPNWALQDIAYIRKEAGRMVSIAQRERTSSFAYPDVSSWEPPSNQSDAVVRWQDSLALSGLGKLEPKGREYKSGPSIWQWFVLPFGQSIFAKRRAIIKGNTSGKQMPRNTPERPVDTRGSQNNKQQERLDFTVAEAQKRGGDATDHQKPLPHLERFPGLDKATDIIIASGFDNEIIGRLINLSIEETGGIEAAVGLSAIVAKARLARMRRK
ncbi:ADP-ribosylglycohydrolase family protein [Komagataeibacter oboediens]|uniref:ADP-ribosylglycohydrolase family protein n=1 Tax=Komagataeibacter oboediens TaxID=65958 RepID=UPI001902EFF0|nr:ADP-ribosylglycohydrolase family protein [Komagataeibacter oboediens]GCE78995.1 ADP-ribosylation/Crystallin J1 [Komagataeibacter oboediens]